MCVRDGGGLRPSLALHRKDTFRMGVQITAIFLDKLQLLKSINLIECVAGKKKNHIYIEAERLFEAADLQRP